MLNKVEVGDIASCQQGRLGLVLRIRASEKTGIVYEGIQLEGKDFGKRWQSWSPEREVAKGVWLQRALWEETC